MAADQRYCLECGQRRGEPRLPFMDAVVLMDTVVKGPQQGPPRPTRQRRARLSANATLIAGIGTLLLALGIGVLIGRSGKPHEPGRQQHSRGRKSAGQRRSDRHDARPTRVGARAGAWRQGD